jgi:isopenicillin N synthase-like dioxygenase
MSKQTLPIIDLSNVGSDFAGVARQIGAACETHGFFYIANYGEILPAELEDALDAAARDFFRLPEEEKAMVAMRHGGPAWRGFFPVGGELTSGKPDLKEGFYFGTDLKDAAHPLVAAKTPLHGANLYPQKPSSLAALVPRYMAACKEIGQLLASLIAASLGLPPHYFRRDLVRDPLELFRIFHYPPRAKIDMAKVARKLVDAGTGVDEELWGVGEHTDYGFLTILKQDSVGGLQVRSLDSGSPWIDAPPIPHTLVINIGDMLELLSRGLFRSTPHRVNAPKDPNAMRLSFPYFFDPGFTAAVGSRLPLPPATLERAADAVTRRRQQKYARWDTGDADVVAFRGMRVYGDYVLSKVARCFPDLFADVIRAMDEKGKTTAKAVATATGQAVPSGGLTISPSAVLISAKL